MVQETGMNTGPGHDVAVTRNCRVHLGEDGIIRERVLPGAVETLADAQAAIAAVAQISGGERRPLFIDMRQVKAVEREARALFSSEEASRTVSAVALLVGSPVSVVIGNFLLGLNRLGVPTHLFTSEAKALAWLRNYLT